MDIEILASYDPQTLQASASFHNLEVAGKPIDYTAMRGRLTECFAQVEGTRVRALNAAVRFALRLRDDSPPGLEIEVTSEADADMTVKDGLAILAKILDHADEEVTTAAAPEASEDPVDSANRALPAPSSEPDAPDRQSGGEATAEPRGDLQSIPELRHHDDAPADAPHHRRVKVITELNLDTGTYELSFENQSHPGEGIEYLEVRALMAEIFQPRRSTDS